MAVEDAGRTARFHILLPCSGGKFLATTLAVGLAALVLGETGPVRRVVLLLGLVPLAIAGNAMRVAALTLCGVDYGQATHTLVGLGCFAVITIVVAWIGAPRGAGAPCPGHPPWAA